MLKQNKSVLCTLNSVLCTLYFVKGGFMGNIALVFAGGGGKGSYQIGVWKALKELGLDKHIKGLSGTSIGALNATLFLQGDYDLAEEIWINISQEKMLPVDKKLILRNMFCVEASKKKVENIMQWAERLEEYGTVSREGLLNIIDSHLDYDSIINSDKPCYVTCCKLPDIEPRYFKLSDYDGNKIRDILLGTSAIPLVFDKVLIEDKYYVDGGLKDNVPIKPIYEDNFDTIIVVHFNRKNRIDKTQYPYCNIIEIIPSRDQGGWISGTLDFSSYGALERIIQGYKDTLKVFEGVFDDYKECYNMESYLRYKQDIMENNLNEILDYKESLEDGIKKIRHIKIINNNLRKVSKVNKNTSI